MHLEKLSESFDAYFSAGDITEVQRWIIDPFFFDIDSMSDNDLIKDNLIDIRVNKHSQVEFNNLDLEKIWCSQLKSFPELSRKALEILTPFATTYLCEMGFSSLLHIKSKFRNRLIASDDMRVALSKKKPRFNEIIANKQQQSSH